MVMYSLNFSPLRPIFSALFLLLNAVALCLIAVRYNITWLLVVAIVTSVLFLIALIWFIYEAWRFEMTDYWQRPAARKRKQDD